MEEWRKIARQEMNRDGNTRRICKIDDTELFFVKGRQVMWLPRAQLEKVLQEKEA